jgi:pimeloyl-ACP methyl ester carboxylesterase
MKGHLHDFRWILAAALIMMTAGLTGCRYLSIPVQDDAVPVLLPSKGGKATSAYNSSVIKGRVTGPGWRGNSTLIVACSPADKKNECAEYAATGLNQDTFMLYLPEGRYRLFAVTDYNHNGKYEKNETSGVYGSGSQVLEIVVREGQLISGVEIRTAAADEHPVQLPQEWRRKKDEPLIRQVTGNGDVLKIYHEYFSLENAQIGYWNPSSFMKMFGAHIYLTQAYDPRKIPLLFVHGTEGSPQNWIYFDMRLDRSKYQPWFFYYPSGIRLNLASALLYEELRELHEKFGFRKMALVAHSVGGLTTKAFLDRYGAEEQNTFVRLFVSFATPWSGFGLADASQILPHKSIPVWLDLGTQSDFISATMNTKLPSIIHYYLFYGKTDKLAGETALDSRAVVGAAGVYGFDCTHDSILSDRRVFSQFNKILEKGLR